MKNNKKLFGGLLIFAVIAILAACTKEEYTYPPQKSYTVDFDTNTTISELKALYQGSAIQIDTDLVISGTVISDDSQGNFYEKLVIQDSTGGIDIEINSSDLFVKYPLGSLVYVKCKDLILENYKGRGVLQLRFNSNGSSLSIPAVAFPKIIFRVDGGVPIVPKVKKIHELTENDINTFIRLEGVEFSVADTALNLSAPVSGTTSAFERTIEDFYQNTAVLRTSSYATFIGTPVPNGNGKIDVVYSVFGSTKQLYINSPSNMDMNGERISRTYVLNELFTTSLSPFTANSVSGTASWYKKNYNGKDFANITGYNQGANEDWLISPALDLSTFTNAYISFNYAANYVSTWDNLKLMVSTDYTGTGNPNDATWQELNYTHTDGASWTFISSGPVDIRSFTGQTNVHFAFKYTCGTSGAATWEIDAVSVVVQ